MNKRKFTIEYIVADFLGTGLAWTLFYIYRKLFIEPAKYGYSVPIKFNENYYLAIIIIPLFWIFLYWIAGSYKDIYRKSRLKEIISNCVIVFIGTLILFFFLLLDDEVRNFKFYRYTFLTLFTLQFFITGTLRLVILTMIKNKIRNRIISFKTVLLGSNKKSLDLFLELENEKYSQGYNILGFIKTNEENDNFLSEHLPELGDYKNLPEIIQKHDIEIVILAIDSKEHYKLNEIISTIEAENVSIKVIPDIYDMISGSVKLNYIFGAALMDISPRLMTPFQQNLKRVIDFVASALVLVLLSPFFLLFAILIKLDSEGPVFYKQERIGKNSKPFMIFKFRTMKKNAETKGPELSSDNDPRITKIGKWLRRYRLDEIVQFYNVLIGDMSIIGPRPERQFYIDQIIKTAPQYKHLLKVKPGITSWGQIKFGYAENVEQMIERMKYDILYIENMSPGMDFKIAFYTILIILKGKGK